MINLEIKVVASNIEEIKNKAIKIGVSNNGVLQQTDTYLLVGKKRLKLREETDRNHLVFYVRENTNDSKFSKYYIVNIPKYLSPIIKKILSAIFGVKVIVNKKRELLIYKNTRIHLDEVVGLGNFVELETVCKSYSEEDKYIEEFNEVKNKLFLNKYESVAGSYSDLLESKN